MPRRFIDDALVLRSVDIGEADRFCVLFTRKNGRFAARARGVRKPGSRMGGVLLPYAHARLEFTESGSNITITSASEAEADPLGSAQLQAFLHLQRGVEMLLQLTDDGEEMPALFDLTLAFFHACRLEHCRPVPAYSIGLLALLGHLPATLDDSRFRRASAECRAYVLRHAAHYDIHALCEEPSDTAGVGAFIDSVLEGVLQRPLKTMRIF